MLLLYRNYFGLSTVHLYSRNYKVILKVQIKKYSSCNPSSKILIFTSLWYILFIKFSLICLLRLSYSFYINNSSLLPFFSAIQKSNSKWKELIFSPRAVWRADPVLLWLFQECLKPQIKESLKLNFVRSKYDCNSINVGVSFPLSWIVREHLINLHLAKRYVLAEHFLRWRSCDKSIEMFNDPYIFNNLCSSDVEERISTTALKDVLRIVIQLQYEAIGLVLSASSPLSVIVVSFFLL